MPLEALRTFVNVRAFPDRDFEEGFRQYSVCDTGARRSDDYLARLWFLGCSHSYWLLRTDGPDRWSHHRAELSWREITQNKEAVNAATEQPDGASPPSSPGKPRLTKESRQRKRKPIEKSKSGKSERTEVEPLVA
jgi:hypothetical protein